jgi:uncharacterized protein with FMN-binding domain
MARKQSQQTFNVSRIINKFFVSSFVVFAFIAYVVNQRLTKPDSALSLSTSPSGIVAPQPLPSSQGSPDQSIPADSNTVTSQSNSAIVGAAPLQPSAPQTGGYKDGTYTGPQVDAYYGMVEVQATVQKGKIVNVQFLQYPSDRRTSVRINKIAMPYLQKEALQVQSAHVNTISGATFTSEGFAMSLDAALNSAKN